MPRKKKGVVTKIENMKNENDKYLIICANCAHPSGELKWFLVQDADENTAVFDTFEDAKEWCDESKSDIFAYTILATSDFSYR